jgi:DNA-binding NarL/FixJ family response regulator
MLPSTQPFKILIVDDHPLLRAGLKGLLALEPDMIVAGETGTGAEAIRHIRLWAPDVVLLDWFLPDATGAEIAREIKAARPKARILLYTACEDERIIESAVRAGADGYLLKGEDTETLLHAVRAAARGESLAGRSLRRAGTPDGNGKGAPLTRREMEVALLVAEGRSNKEIACRIGISEPTVKFHVGNLFRKLAVAGRMELAIRVNSRFASYGELEAGPQEETRIRRRGKKGPTGP